jgi:protein-S-isoprenylcysteine O-methyltransferase Ste14
MSGPQARTPLVAWLGGAAFLASLGFFAWSYFVRFGRPTDQAELIQPLLVDLGLFTVFALHHSLLARTGAKQWVTRHAPEGLERSLYVWISSVLFVAVCAAWRDVPGELYRHAGLASVPHWLLVGLGGWLTARAAAILDPLELAGIRPALPAPGGFHAVGPYALVRHPIYLGWLLLVFGVPVMNGTRLAFAVISSAYLVVAIPLEERSLVEAFGDEYRRYQRQVRWRLVPGVW